MSKLVIPDLLHDESLRRHEFPVCEKKIFLAHAGVSPLPRRVAEAMQQYVAAAASDNQEEVVPDAMIDETRALAGDLIEAQPEEIAFVGSTSMGLALVAAGLPWKPGDNVVCYRDDYPANVYPWMDLARQGVDVRFVEPGQFGNVTWEDVERAVDGGTRLVALASAHFQSGWRLDVDRIGKSLRERGVLFCLDGIQSLGALRTVMKSVDFAAADAHKWLLGPVGVAILYVRKEHFERLHPPLVGWHSAACPDYIAQETLVFRPDARRYEPGSLNLAGIVGLRAALQLILECGIDAIEARVLALANTVIARGIEAGFSIVGPRGDAGRSGIVSMTVSGCDVGELHARLEVANIGTSLRRCRDGRRCLRISAHFYNREDEIAALFEVAQPRRNARATC
ncbi:MAG TPA: aminotransferase class V-fold PLP-dependent enzyme [Verrucomicrobiae bacterium]|nr:aminotransferase class V-fold PLP-dependent enzyme [Verrucomicrobiae bacterium]